MPARSADDQLEQAAWMAEVVAPAIRAIGVSYQLNFQMLLGASTSGEDMRSIYDWELIVDSRGCDARGVACPIGPRFRLKMGKMIQLWANTHPDILWIDDDFRLHNHGLADQYGMDYYCYCENHLSGFTQNIGHPPLERERLLRHILAPGAPAQMRSQWLDYLGETMVDTAAWIRREVSTVSPETRVALMISNPETHSAEGRDWGKLLGALSGPHRPMTRPCCRCYTGTNFPIKTEALSYALMGKSMCLLESAFGLNGADVAPELENTRFTTWAASVASSQYTLVLAQLLGTAHITLSLNDLDGSAIDEEPTTVPMLTSVRPRLEALARLQLRNWEPLGVTMLVDPRGASKLQLRDGQQLHHLAGERPWEELILQAGIPVKFSIPGQPISSDSVLILDEYAAWCLTDDQIVQSLGGAVLLDADAARVLQHRGFGEYLGLYVDDCPTPFAVSESYVDHVLPGVYAIRVPLRSNRWRSITVQNGTPYETKTASWFIDGLNNRYIGSTIHENRLGGRIGVFASIGDMHGGTFFSHARVRWLRGMLQWLSRGRFAVIPRNTQHGLTVIRRSESEMLVAYANLAADPVMHLALEFAEVRQWAVHVLDASGTWVQAEMNISGRDLQVACNLQPFNWWIGKLADRQ